MRTYVSRQKVVDLEAKKNSILGENVCLRKLIADMKIGIELNRKRVIKVVTEIEEELKGKLRGVEVKKK